MNKEQKKFKKEIKRRKHHTRSLQTRNEERIAFRTFIHNKKVTFVEEHKKRAAMNNENNLTYRKQLCKLLNMSEKTSHEYSTEALEALHEAKQGVEVTED